MARITFLVVWGKRYSQSGAAYHVFHVYTASKRFSFNRHLQQFAFHTVRKFMNVLSALYQVELLTKDDWGKICHLSNFCGGFFAIESIQKHKRENKPRIETVHVQIIFATKRARISSSMDLSALCSTKSRRRSWTLKLLKYVMFHVWEVFLYFHLLSVPLHHFYQLGNLYGLHLPYFNEPLTRIFLALKRMSLKKK